MLIAYDEREEKEEDEKKHTYLIINKFSRVPKRKYMTADTFRLFKNRLNNT